MFVDRNELFVLLAEKKAVPTICEGKKDVTALKHFGFSQITMLEGHALYQVVELFEKGSTVQILTDLDAEGKKLFAKLRADLSQRGVHIDNALREALFRTDLRQIEGLISYMDEK